MFMRVRADNRLDRRRGFASKSAGIDQPLARRSGSTTSTPGSNDIHRRTDDVHRRMDDVQKELAQGLTPSSTI